MNGPANLPFAHFEGEDDDNNHLAQMIYLMNFFLNESHRLFSFSISPPLITHLDLESLGSCIAVVACSTFFSYYESTILEEEEKFLPFFAPFNPFKSSFTHTHTHRHAYTWEQQVMSKYLPVKYQAKTALLCVLEWEVSEEGVKAIMIL